MSYLGWKLLHVLGVVLFVGNITTGILWKVHADRTRNPALIAHACAGLTRSDRFFTMPGVALIVNISTQRNRATEKQSLYGF